MKCLGVTKIFSAVGVNASGFVDFETNFGAAGVVLYVVTSNSAAGNFTFGLSARTPDGNVVNLVTSPAVNNSNTTTRVAALPGVTAVANVIANDVIPSNGRFVYTRTGGTYDIEVYAAFFD